jgi:hypothetical protein
MRLHYYNGANICVEYDVYDWDAALNVAHILINSPIEIDYLHYETGEEVGIFNLNTFETC